MLADLDIVIVEAAHEDDVWGIASLYPTKTASEREEMVRNSLDPELVEHHRGKRTILLAKLGSQVIGIAQVVWESDDPALSGPDTAVIHHVRTHPDFREKGVGTCLVQTAKSLAFRRGRQRATLGVEPDNARARRLYTSLGFEVYREYQGEHGERLLALQCWQESPGEDQRVNA